MMPAVPARVDLATSTKPVRGVPGAPGARGARLKAAALGVAEVRSKNAALGVAEARSKNATLGVIGIRSKAAALGVVGALIVPLPAAAAPAPCEQALRYAAQSGAQLMRIGTLDLGPAGRNDQPVRDVGVGDAKSALVAQSTINAAALGRVLDGGPADRRALTEVRQQTAPPNHNKPMKSRHKDVEAGPFRLGAGELTVRARWDPRMACGNIPGEATRAEAELRRAGVLDNGDAALVRVPGKISSLSTTAMERRGPAARAVAAASMAGGKIELLDGAVTITVVRAPSLLATMSGADGGEVRYEPAVIEVSGEGLTTARLDTAGDSVEVRLDQDGGTPGGAGTATAGRNGAAATGAGRTGTAEDGGGRNRSVTGDMGSGGAPAGRQGPRSAVTDGAVEGGGAQGNARRSGAAHGEAVRGSNGPGTAARGAPSTGHSARPGAGNDRPAPHSSKSGPDKRGAATEAANSDKTTTDHGPAQDGSGKPQPGPFAGLPTINPLAPLPPLTLPSLPGLPPLVDRPAETAPAAGPGTTVRISLGDVRQAVSGHAIAAKATAITVAVAKGPDRQAYGSGPATAGSTVLDLDLGLLEVAAVAPEPAAEPATGPASGVAGGVSGGLPITGPRVDLLALAGVALLIAGAAALVFGLRGRSRP